MFDLMSLSMRPESRWVKPAPNDRLRLEVGLNSTPKCTVSRCRARGQRRNRTANAVAVFHRVETSKERHGEAARGLGVVTELRAIIGKRAEIAGRSGLAEAAPIEVAALAADEEAVAKIGAPTGIEAGKLP